MSRTKLRSYKRLTDNEKKDPQFLIRDITHVLQELIG